MVRSSLRIGRLALLGLFMVGCGHFDPDRKILSTTAAGLNAKNVVDEAAQEESDRLGDTAELNRLAERIRAKVNPTSTGPKKTILALSGGGCYGAYSAGVLYGWTQQGTRPTFDVVTGISTGSLIAPLAFLGSKYDDEIKRFYTTLNGKDIYQLRVIRGLFSESLASNAPLAKQVDSVLSPQVICEIATEHRKGRRLYVGTTQREGRQFVVWDIGAIACRGQADDRDLIKHILLGSAAIPGFFPSSHIPVTVDGKQYMEHHIDGGTSATVFIRPPYMPPDAVNQVNPVDHMTGTDLYVIIAGKLYADPDVVKSRALKIALTSVSTTAYAQTRGDLQRLYFLATLTGMNFNMASIPTEYPAPKTNTDFDTEVMTGMFNEGIRQVQLGKVWRKSPPGLAPGESPLGRSGTNLTVRPRNHGSEQGSEQGSGQPCCPPTNGMPVAPLPAISPAPVPFPTQDPWRPSGGG